MQKFWWDHQESKAKIHWMSWELMGISKNQGGLGFRDLVCFNKALMAKQCWRLLKNPNSLAAQIIKAKYYSQSSILEATLGTRPSFAWRSLMATCDALKNGLEWRVGDGRDIRIWGDKWILIPISYSNAFRSQYLTQFNPHHEFYPWMPRWWSS